MREPKAKQFVARRGGRCPVARGLASVTGPSASGRHARVFAVSPDVRYVAIADGPHVDARCRPGLAGASAAESDRYEELLVNPALLLLARQRGEIDCGGLRYVVVGYGNFQQLVLPYGNGHLSVALELGADPAALAEAVLAAVVGDGEPVGTAS